MHRYFMRKNIPMHLSYTFRTLRFWSSTRLFRKKIVYAAAFRK